MPSISLFKRSLMMSGLCLTAAFPFASQANPWVLPVGANFISVSNVQQSADEFYKVDVQTPIADLSMSVLWINFARGLSDTLSLDFQTGYARSTFDQDTSNLPSGFEKRLTGLADSKLGISWQVVNGQLGPLYMPTVAIRAGLIFKGDYDLGQENSIGDGGDGYELSVSVGKFITPSVAISAELGLRDRSSPIPTENYYHLKAETFFSNTIGLSANYTNNDAKDGLQIGIPPFNKSKFPALEEDYELASIGVNLQVTPQVTLAASGGKIVGGRNTAKSDIFSFSLGYGF